MKSIRLSLILYFLVLLAAALGGISYFCYQSTHQALEAKEASTHQLLTEQHKVNCKRVTEDFDEDLLKHGKDLAKNLDNKGAWVFHSYEKIFPVPPFLLTQARLPSLLRAVRPYDYLPPAEDEEGMPLVGKGEYFQISSIIRPGGRGDTLFFRPLARSDNLPHWFKPVEVPRQNWQGHFDNVEIQGDPNHGEGEKVLARRVSFLATLSASDNAGFGGRPRFPPFFFRKDPEGYRSLSVLFYFARDTRNRDLAMAALERKLERDLSGLKEDLENNLAELRTQMLWIGLGTFAALVVGGFLLVHLGLSPLNRLTEAVRRISAKDFRLSVDPARLPRELQPIAGRLAETLAELKRVFAREKQAAADISHELRTPLATLLTTIEVTLNKPRTIEQYREVLEDCRYSGQHMNKLVERLLTLARLDAGAAQLRPCAVDVNSLAEQCADLVRPLARARNLDLHVHTNGPAVFQADPDKLREILSNLLYNAIEYNRPNGSVAVTVARNNGAVTLEVRDTGIGIPPEARAHIFERFFRADPARHAEGHAGLGLSIVKGYVDLMGGTVDVDSGPQGSTFRVQLPAKETAMAGLASRFADSQL